jgi:anti-sigma-K factor RskA
MTHDDVRSLAGEYALGALEAGERLAVERHLAECAGCRAYVAADARALDALGRGVPQVAPPADLRARVLAAARPPRPAPRALAPWLAAAAALILFAGAAWQATRRGADHDRSMAIVAAADLVRFDLRADGPGSARARALWSHRHGMVFTAEGLAPLPEGRTYQLWVISRGAPISAGVFDVTDGRARMVMATPDTLTQVDAVAVTVEPAGGLPAPSTSPILVGSASE